jgi:hypothetical protein
MSRLCELCGKNAAQVTIIGLPRRYLCIPCYALRREWGQPEEVTLVHDQGTLFADPAVTVRLVGRERPSISARPVPHRGTKPAHRRGGKR